MGNWCLLWPLFGGLAAHVQPLPSPALQASLQAFAFRAHMRALHLNPRFAAFTQGVVHPVTAISGLALLACPLFNWLLIFKLRLGLDGAVAALVATWLYMLAMLAAFLIWHERRRHGTPQQTWHGWWVGGMAGRPSAGVEWSGGSMLGWHYHACAWPPACLVASP